VKKTAQVHKNNAEPNIKSRLAKWIMPASTVFLAIVLAVTAVILKNRPSTTNQPAEQLQVAEILPSDNIDLPQPDLRSGNSIEAVLKNRQTRRDFVDQELSLKQVSQMLWSAQGVTIDWGGRTTSSTRSVYPLTVYLIASKVKDLDPGQYQYIPGDRTPIHELKPMKKVELKDALFDTLNQSPFKNAPAVLVVTGNMAKMAEAFGGIHHDSEVYLEAGNAAQNLYLQAESLKLGMAVITSFDETAIKGLVTVPNGETVIYLVPFGVPKQ
jgi:SagB-type dehydrogenase family enzyme